MNIWSEDAVRFKPGSQPDVGKQAIQVTNEKFVAEYPGFKVLSYTANYKDIQIEDGLACEWGEHESQFKMSPEAPPVSWRGTGFHVLKRQSDGSWKFAVMILNYFEPVTTADTPVLRRQGAEITSAWRTPLSQR